MKKNYLFILLSILFFACNNENKRGVSFDIQDVQPFNEALAKNISQTDTLHAIIEGEVESVCSMSGCWMNLKSNDGDSELFVQFKDHEFSVPKEILGKKATMKGKAFLEVTSVEELKQYAEDDGLSQEEIDAITSPEKELRFLATGVIWE